MLVQKTDSPVNPRNPQVGSQQDNAQRRAIDRVLMSDKSAEAKLIEIARLRGASADEIHRFVVPHTPKGGAQ